VSKRFGSVTALNNIDLTVPPGEVVALLGENGAGKSTLLRILATTILADEGRASVAGYDVETASEAVRRSVGILLPDERAWYLRLTGFENLHFFGALYGLSLSTVKRRSRELLEEFDLLHAANRPFSSYSSGMRLRLSLARSLIPEPEVLLLDEPTRSLDPVATKGFRDLVGKVVQSRGTAVLVSTHDLHEAGAMGSRVAILSRGRLVNELPRATDAATLERHLLVAAQ
jgi:ABC-2 type transport system ATP-binding protein